MAKVRMLVSKRKHQQLNQNRVYFVRRKVARRSKFPSPSMTKVCSIVAKREHNVQQDRWIFIGKNKRMATWWRRKIDRALKFPSPPPSPSPASPSASSSSSSDYGYCRRLSFDDDDDEPSTTYQSSRTPPPASPPPPGFPFPIYKAKSPSEDDCSTPYHIPDAKPPSSPAMAATASTRLSRGCCCPRTPPQSSPPPPGFPFPIYRSLTSDSDDSSTYPFYYDCQSSFPVSSSLPSLTLTLAPPGRRHGNTTTSSPPSCSQRLLLPDLNA